MKKVRKVCKYCGSSDVSKDAYAEWDEDKQEWTLDIFHDNNGYCEECNGETTIIDEEINDA